VLARDLGLPCSTTYHLLAELIAAGFVVHLPEERRYGLGVSAFEIGSAYARQEPLARLARPVLAPGRRGRALRAPGRAARARGALRRRAAGAGPPAAGDRRRRAAAGGAHGQRQGDARRPARPARPGAVPDASAFVDRHGIGPRRLTDLRRMLQAVRRSGSATEDGEVTPGFASVAAAVHDHAGRPVASVAVTFPAEDVGPRDEGGARPARHARRGPADSPDQRAVARRLTAPNCLGSRTRPDAEA
jgi:hypothetical protein